MAISTRVTLTRLATTDDKMSVNACWAPSTSLFNRLIRAPVWVRVKKEMGIFWMCSKTRDRMSKMSPSPTLADTHRSAIDSPASNTASPPAMRARVTIRLRWCPSMPLLMMSRKMRGLATPITASTTINTMKKERMLR